MKRTLSLILASLLTLSLFAGIGLPAAASTSDGNVTTIDTDHPLATGDAIETFEAEGYVEGHVGQLDMTLSVAEESADAGVDSRLETDFNAVYLRAQYNETIDRSVRVYIPNELWYSYPSQAEQSITNDIGADFEPTREGEYTAVTLHFEDVDENGTDAVFRVSKEASTVFSLRDTSSGFVENVTGYELPTIAASTEWQYAQDAFAGNESTVAIDHDGEIVLEYDGDDTPGRERWQTVPDCSSSAGVDAVVCQYERQGVENTTYVMSRTSKPPALRYTDDRSWLDGFRSTVMNDLEAALEKAMDQVAELRPGFIVEVHTW
ncbi:hypothetical protein [Natronosalvus rutilus]|uniref:Uncharacterized protein n=1 Tax=Natronosalvus rutilus TaxID=2953753 RepID=A0A9E7N6S6_9EURY|nr:hypothetical protein [Natronosalvus rutilus]UTF52757.1 hypothetical protein NGM29_13320 [Natronosalvus rutilus]